MNAENFRARLQDELIQRCRNNPSYSLRAFARSLSLEPSALSKILRGRRAISASMVDRLAPRLGMDPEESRIVRNSAKKGKLPAHEFAQLSADTFRVISDWYHYAILELTTLHQFHGNTAWIARTLGITVSEVNIAVERLVRLEFLEIDKNGKWKDVSGNITTVGNEFTAAAFRNLQKQILRMAAEAMEKVPMEERDQSSLTLAVDARLLPKAKEKIKKFRRELSAFLQSSEKRDRVYQVSLSLYPVTKIGSPRRGKNA